MLQIQRYIVVELLLLLLLQVLLVMMLYHKHVTFNNALCCVELRLLMIISNKYNDGQYSNDVLALLA